MIVRSENRACRNALNPLSNVRNRTLLGLVVLVVVGVASAPSAYAQVTLQRKFDVKSYKNQETSKLTQVLTLAGMDVETAVNSTSTQTFTVSPGEDGLIKLKQKTDAVKVDYALPMGMSFSYDSKDANPKQKIDNPQLQPIVDMLQAVSKAVITYTINPKNGNVTSAEGGQQVLDSLEPQSKAFAESQLKPDELRKAHEEEFFFLPTKPVKVGDTWSKSEVRNLGQGQSLSVEVDYSYKGTTEKGGKTYHEILGAVKNPKFKMEGEAQGVSVTDSDLKVAKGTKTILFDGEKGLIFESKSDVTIEGKMTLKAGGMEIPATIKLGISEDMNLVP